MSELIFRADADSQIGTGHLMRSLALAQSRKAAGGSVTFITNCESAALRERLKRENLTIVEIEKSYPHESDFETTRKVLKKHSPETWCVVDGYHFDAGFHGKIRRNGNRVLVIDDTAHLPFYEADAILNQNVNADELNYNCSENTTLLLGTQYALLRREFLACESWRRETPETARRILITMGGGDFHNQTLKAICAVERLAIENLQVKAVVGAGNPHYADLERHIKSSHVPINLIKNAENMSELMTWADAAISAAGSTCWEMALLRLPCVLIVTAENQVGIADGLGKNGFAENVGWFEQVSEERLAEKLDGILRDAQKRGQMSKRGGEIVDGRGAARVIEKLGG